MSCGRISTSTTGRAAAPQALFNGHLTASNSDVRAGENPKLHNARWTGLVSWWQNVFGKMKDSKPKEVDLANSDLAVGPVTPLPPDRPPGAAPERIEDAAQEFLTDWLVRRQYDQALEFLSPQAYACVNLSDDARGQALDAAGVRSEARKLMEYASARLGRRANLTSAIVAFTPRDPNRPITDHPFKKEFLLGPVSESEARQYLCSQSTAPAASAGTDYYGVIFTFRVDGGGTLGLLWNREGGQLEDRVVSAARALTSFGLRRLLSQPATSKPKLPSLRARHGEVDRRTCKRAAHCVRRRRHRESSVSERLADEAVRIEVHLPVVLRVAVRPHAQLRAGRRELQNVHVGRR